MCPAARNSACRPASTRRPTGIAAADIDRDGDLDLALGDNDVANHGTWVLLNQSAAPLPFAGVAATGGAPSPTGPNPSHLPVVLFFDLPEPGNAVLNVHDVRGRLVKELWSGPLGAGPHRFDWDGRDRAGHRAAAGVYFARWEAEGRREVRRAVVF